MGPRAPCPHTSSPRQHGGYALLQSFRFHIQCVCNTVTVLIGAAGRLNPRVLDKMHVVSRFDKYLIDEDRSIGRQYIYWHPGYNRNGGRKGQPEREQLRLALKPLRLHGPDISSEWRAAGQDLLAKTAIESWSQFHLLESVNQGYHCIAQPRLP